MKDETLKLSTKKSLFDPVKIEIDDKTYESNPLSKQLMDDVLSDKLQKEATEGKLEALYKQVRLLYDIESGVLEKLDVRDVGRIIRYTMEKITEASEAEKNLKGPGDKE